MKDAVSISSKMIESIRQAALSLADVQENLACKGTAIQSAAFKIKGKSFLFVRPGNIMLKLDKSITEAGELAAKNPESLKVGKGGWTTITSLESKDIKSRLMSTWIKESYELFSPSVSPKKASRKSAA